VTGGDVGFAEAYADGDWSTPDLRALFDLALQNEAALTRTTDGWWVTRALRRLYHRQRANSRRGSRWNIAAHYDLGNDFYAKWLDRGMNYSSALYESDVQTIEQAQAAKLTRVVELLEIEGGERVLEIGCGWGGMADRLVRDHACLLTGVTLSIEQLSYARRRLADAEGRADLRLQDYRDIEGRFDRIVSIEMMEAVGEEYWALYFDTLRERLRDGGIAVLQIITIAEERFAAYRARPDFIQRHIFPGGMLPTDDIIRSEAARAGLRLVAHECFGQSYARTLQEWRLRFLQSWPQLERMGFDRRFRRLWEYYLIYCEAGFRSGATCVAFYKLQK
jgi:cyclopropane-fatty-acyl-phospholipid synthase